MPLDVDLAYVEISAAKSYQGHLFCGVLSEVHLPASGRGLGTARPLPWWLPSRGAKLQSARASPWPRTAAAPKNDRVGQVLLGRVQIQM